MKATNLIGGLLALGGSAQAAYALSYCTEKEWAGVGSMLLILGIFLAVYKPDRKCPKCQLLIDDKATRCPHCHADI